MLKKEWGSKNTVYNPYLLKTYKNTYLQHFQATKGAQTTTNQKIQAKNALVVTTMLGRSGVSLKMIFKAQYV